MSTKQELSVKNEPIEDIVPHNSLKKELNDESTSFLNTPQNNFKKLVIKNEPVAIKDESVTGLDMWNFNEDIEIKMENIDNKYEICDSKEKLFFKLEDNEMCENEEETRENINNEQTAVFTKGNKLQEPKDASQNVSVSLHNCNICARSFTTGTLLQNHLTLLHHFQDFKSGSCEIESAAKNIGSSYSNMNSVIIGNKIAQRKSVCCKNGKKQFNSGRKYANRFNLTYDMQANDNERFGCDFCNMHFKMKSSLISHLKSHNGQSYQCTSCVKYFESIRGLCNHMFKKHGLYYKSVDIKREYYNNKQYKCSVCEKSYKDKYDVKKHSVIHSNNAFVCHVCKKKFQSQRYLLEHMLVHTGERKYMCEVCSKSFKRKSHLTVHSFQHGEKPYTCDKCEKSFVQKSVLALHVNVCSGKKQCLICREMFLRNELLESHVEKRECNVENMLICDNCGSLYRNRKKLVAHMSYAHKIQERFKCSNCGNTYKNKLGVHRHLTVHMGEKPLRYSS